MHPLFRLFVCITKGVEYFFDGLFEGSPLANGGLASNCSGLFLCLPAKLCLLEHVDKGEGNLLRLGEMGLTSELHLYGVQPTIYALEVIRPVELRDGNLCIQFECWLGDGNGNWSMWGVLLLLCLYLN